MGCDARVKLRDASAFAETYFELIQQTLAPPRVIVRPTVGQRYYERRRLRVVSDERRRTTTKRTTQQISATHAMIGALSSIASWTRRLSVGLSGTVSAPKPSETNAITSTSGEWVPTSALARRSASSTEVPTASCR